MMSKAKDAHLPITDTDIDSLDPRPDTLANSNPLLFDIRNIGAADRRHYTAEDLDGWRCMPDGCPVETEADEKQARKVTDGIETLPEAVRRRAEMLWEIAVRRAMDKHNVSLDMVEDPFVGLILARIAIVDDATLSN